MSIEPKARREWIQVHQNQEASSNNTHVSETKGIFSGKIEKSSFLSRIVDTKCFIYDLASALM
jgi:hypothetical protein